MTGRCDECGAEFASDASSEVGRYHKEICSLHPDNIVEVQPARPTITAIVRRMLDVTTAVIPDLNHPDFDFLRSVEHEHGWIVFVTGEPRDVTEGHWIYDLHRKACEKGCILINFDSDAPPEEDVEEEEDSGVLDPGNLGDDPFLD